MAVLIPSIGSCTFDSGGERRVELDLTLRRQDGQPVVTGTAEVACMDSGRQD